MFQADSEEGLAVALLQPLGRPAAAAVHVSDRTLLIDKLLQLQLKESGASDLAQERRQD